MCDGYYIVLEWSTDRQRLGKQGLKFGIAAETEVNSLSNGTQTPNEY
jgi:hypothetical protein